MEVVLQDRQINHFNECMNILDKSFYLLELSPLGSGKTHVISKIAQVRKFKNIFVVCPKSVIPTWEKSRDDYNLPISEGNIITYESFKTEKLGLFKIKTKETEEDTIKIYYPTKKLDNLIEEGCLFVFDEFQKSKNANTSIHIACKTLILRVSSLSKDYESKVILATGTIIDKEQQALGFMQLVGIQKNETLYTNYRGMFEYEKYGFMEIINYCKSLNENLTKKAIKEGSEREDGTTFLGNDNIHGVIFNLFYRIILKYFSSEMQTVSYEVPIDIKNGYYILSDNRSKQLNNEIIQLKNAVKYNEKTDVIFEGGKNTGSISTYLKNIEYF